MLRIGQHLILDLFGCNPAGLNDSEFLLGLSLKVVDLLKLQVVSKAIHCFQPHGVSVDVILSESHLALHTWPEYGYASVDIFSCGLVSLASTIGMFGRTLRADRVNVLTILRGPKEPQPPVYNYLEWSNEHGNFISTNSKA